MAVDEPVAPVVRLWEISGVDVGDPGVLAVLEDEALPHIAEQPGYLGSYLLRDLDRARILTLSFWSDLDALEASDAVSSRVAEAFEALTSADVIERSRFEVLGNRPPRSADPDGSLR